MGVYVTSSGNLIVDGSGAPIECSECPCDNGPVGTINCCLNELMAACYSFSIAGITDNAATCSGGHCSDLNGSYTMNWVSACIWRSDEVVIGFCDGCGDSVKATLQVSNSTLFDPCGANKCQLLMTITQDGADDTCFRYSITYRACLAKTDDPLAPIVLSFVSGSAECANYPATITLNAC